MAVKTVEQTIRTAATFLLNSRDQQGWWRDFRLAPGTSDEWVTGYVGTMLAQIPDDRLWMAMQMAWAKLLTRQQRRDGLWGYNYFPPGDADSTGWALQLAHALGEQKTERSRQAICTLQEHYRADGGISTYAQSDPIRAFIQAPLTQSMEGWCSSHDCVSAAIAALPDFTEPLQAYLKSTQLSNGSWLGYWWQDPEYTTALAAEAIATADPTSEAVRRAIDWGLHRLTTQGYVATAECPLGSPFATAWCLRLLGLGRSNPTIQTAIHTGARWLMEQQLPDGSWESSAWLRVPFPDDLHPDRFKDWVVHGLIQGSLVVDQCRIFTTATVLQSLVRWLYPN